MTKWLQKLEDYGVDIPTTMARFVGDEALYKECLQALISENDVHNLEMAIHNNNDKAAFEYAHSLKGVAGNLGLTPLYSVVCELVEAIRCGARDNRKKQLDAIVEEYARVKTLVG